MPCSSDIGVLYTGPTCIFIQCELNRHVPLPPVWNQDIRCYLIEFLTGSNFKTSILIVHYQSFVVEHYVTKRSILSRYSPLGCLMASLKLDLSTLSLYFETHAIHVDAYSYRDTITPKRKWITCCAIKKGIDLALPVGSLGSFFSKTSAAMVCVSNSKVHFLYGENGF